jgi:hypothetical protein
LDEFGSNIFVDKQDLRTSFLFNLLAQSIIIRTYSYDLLDYSEEGEEDWIEYTYSLAGIISNMIYFSSTTTKGLNYFELNDDEDSPYYVDADGNIKRTPMEVMPNEK